MSLHVLALFPALAAGFLAVFALSAKYGIMDRTLPAKAENANLSLRLKVAIGIAMVALSVYTIARWWWAGNGMVTLNWIGGLTLLNMVLMAAAGAMDVWRFKLPLPLTATGLVLSLGLRLAQGGWLEALIAVLAALILSLTWATITRGGIGWGDYLAIIWIMLALSTIGLMAMLVGQLGLTLFHLGKRSLPVPVGGGYLLAAVALFAVPFTSLMDLPPPAQPALPRSENSAPQTVESPKKPARGVAQELAWQASMIAGDVLGKVGMTSPDDRRAAASAAANDLEVLRAAMLDAATLAPCDECQVLAGLLAETQQALRRYDLNAIRDYSARREAIEISLRPEDTGRANQETQK